MLENFGSKTTNIIVLDLEGFKLKSLGFIIKELSLCSSYNDTILQLLSKLLQKTVYNLEDLNCPRISEIISEEQVPSCYLHSNFRLTNDQLSNHCAERKARIFSQWTQSDVQRRHGNFNNLSVRQLEDIHLLDST